MAAMGDLFGSDDEEEQQVHQESEQYGTAHLEDPEEDLGGSPGRTANLFGSDEEEDKGAGQQQGSEDEDEQGRQRTEAAKLLEEAVVPLLPVPAANSVCILRTTNIVGVQPQPFDPATYEREEETFTDEFGRQRVKMLTNAVMRWRVRRLPDGREVRESNARFVRWEDGSMQLLLGDEALDVTEQAMSSNYLFCLRSGGVFQGQGHLSRKLVLRPASLDSGLHKRLRDAVDKRHVKQFKVASHAGMQNPESEKAKRERLEEEKIKSKAELQRKQDRVMARAYGGGGRRPRTSRLSKEYMDDEQEWEGEDRAEYEYDDGLTADQRARLSLARSHSAMDDAAAGRRLQAAKRGAPTTRAGAAAKRRRGMDEDDEEEDEDEDVEFNEEEEEEEEAEYEFSGDEEGSEGEEDDEGGRKSAKAAKAAKPAPAPAAAAPAPTDSRPKARQRRGVVLSDDEDE